MQQQPESRIVNFDFALKTGRDGTIEFWHDNGDGTCTRVSDGLTLTYRFYDELPARHQIAIRQSHARLRWDD